MSKVLKVLITSQKGGVGKSTVSANLAAYFSCIAGKKTSLLDFDHQATSGKWVKKAHPAGIDCHLVDLPNARGSGMTLLKAKEALRKACAGREVVVTDLTWTDVLPPDFLFEFDLVLVPSSLSRVELDSTLDFVDRFSFVFNSRLRPPPKLVIVPSRVDKLQAYQSMFAKSFRAGFFLSPPVMASASASEFFGADYLVLADDVRVRENFIEFGRSVEQLALAEADLRHASPRPALSHRVSGSILDRFRALRHAGNDPVAPVPLPAREKPARLSLASVIPSFLVPGRD